jgi:hypothetical protein
MAPNLKIDDIALFKKWWLEGRKVLAIAAYFDTTDNTVYNFAKKLGLPGRGNRKRQPSRLMQQPELRHRRPKLLHTYANVQELVATGLTYRQALCRFHKQRC